jgi:hypothetical protein
MITSECALEMARRGFNVFPCHSYLDYKIDRETGERESLAKRPRITGWQSKATMNESTIAGWFSKWPDINYGCYTYDAVVIDCDGPIGHQGIQTLNLPPTYRVISGNTIKTNSYHLYYRLPPSTMRPTNGPLNKFTQFNNLDKIDIKTAPGLYVGPGSYHHTGGQYHWEDGKWPASLLALPLAPEWLLNIICTISRDEIARGPGKGKETPENGIGLDSDREWLVQLHAKFPITDKLKRNEQTFLAVQWLAMRGINSDRALRLGSKWLGKYKGTFKSTWELAIKELVHVIRTQYTAIVSGKLEIPDNHTKNACRIGLPARASEQAANITNDLMFYQIPQITGQLLRALLLHIVYRLSQGDDSDAIKMTDRQVMSIHKELSGKKVAVQSWCNFKFAFVSTLTPDGIIKRATVKELMVCTRVGKLGKSPSQYQLTDLCKEWLNEDAE